MKYNINQINNEIDKIIGDINSTNPQYNNSYKCDSDTLTLRLAKLKVLFHVVNSGISDYDKAYTIFQIYPSAESFRKSYGLLVKFGYADHGFDDYRRELSSVNSIYSKYLEYENNSKLFNNIKYRLEMENMLNNGDYLDNYIYAEFIISQYINEPKSYKFNNFLQRLNINKDTFEYCLNVVKLLNPTLYERYEEKYNNNNGQRNTANLETFQNLFDGINNGFLRDGTRFDLLEFLKRVPFKSSDRYFLNTVADYLYKNLGSSDVRDVIIKYIYSNRIKTLTHVSEDKLSKQKTWINGIEITPDINHIIFKYMYAYDLPNISKVYDILVEKYIKNELELSNLDEMINDKNERMNKEKINIPYVLVRK